MYTLITLASVLAAVSFTSAMPTLQSRPQTIDPRALFVIHRHGERTLAATFGGDPLNNATIWPDGLSQITLDGRRRMYQVGQFLYEKYGSLIGDNPKNVYVRSSGIDRCLESGQMVVHAMYPPKGRWVWDSTQTWQPIPIYTIYKPNDGMLNPGATCPLAKQEEHSIMNQDYAQKYVQKFTPLMNYITEHIGFEVNDIFTAKAVFDSVFTARINQKPVPEWVTEDIFKQLAELYDATFELEFSSRLSQRMRTGVLFNEIKKRLSDMVNPPAPKPFSAGIRWDDVNDLHKNVFVYSTHDSMIAALLSALNVYDNKAPPFGASLLIEVFGPQPEQAHQSVQSETFLRFGYLKHTETRQIEYLQLPVCDQQLNGQPACSLEQFWNAVNDLEMPLEQWNQECQKSHN